MRIVLDTNILVRAVGRARGPASAALRIIAASEVHSLVLSPFIVEELERVLNYPRIRDMLRIDEREAAELVAAVRQVGGELVYPGPAPRIVPSDSDDDAIVHTAVIGRAEALCTLNRHLFHRDVQDYCLKRGVLIVTDVELLSLLRRPAAPYTPAGT